MVPLSYSNHLYPGGTSIIKSYSKGINQLKPLAETSEAMYQYTQVNNRFEIGHTKWQRSERTRKKDIKNPVLRFHFIVKIHKIPERNKKDRNNETLGTADQSGGDLGKQPWGEVLIIPVKCVRERESGFVFKEK